MLAPGDLPAQGPQALRPAIRHAGDRDRASRSPHRGSALKRHHNSLYVTTQGAYLAKEGETVVVKIDGEARLRCPLHHLEGIVCFGQISVSPYLMEACAERSVVISYFTENGRYLASVRGASSGNVLLRRAQYRLSDDLAAAARLAGSMVAAKTSNCRTTLLRALRDRPEGTGAQRLREAATELEGQLRAIAHADDLDRLRGLEGLAARDYFGAFDDLISQQKEDFRFTGRSRRPPLDRVNALLSFVYTLLVHDARGALESVGLDPAVGFLHRDRPGRPGLALDLIEEFRPFVADRVVLSLINLKQVTAANFRTTESGAVLLDDEGRKALLVAYQTRKQEEIHHAFLGEKTTVGMLVHLQALLLARAVRGDLDGYPAFFWR